VLRFEQHVATRPAARFLTQTRLTYYINEPFVASSKRSSDGTIQFEGLPPFQVRLSMKNLENKQMDIWTVDVPTTPWKVEYPSYHFSTPGTYILTIDAVLDASNCGRATIDARHNSIPINVLRTANIIPMQHQDLCVGQYATFGFEDSPPWTIM
jgi:nucleoporin POM152